MKMKKRFLGILLSLSLVLGLMPGMSLTAYAEEYQLWVGGTQVTSANASNIDGNNTASYDADTKTLTLNNYSNDGSAVHKWGDPPQGAPEGSFINSAAIYASEALTISISGNNTVKGSENAGLSENHGVYVVGDLNITGSGVLDVQSGRDGRAISGTNVTINSGTVKARADGDGIYAINNVDMKGGTVETTSQYRSGIVSYNGNVTIENGTVTAADTSDSTGGTAGIATANGNVIIKGGSVNATSVNTGISGKNVSIESGTVAATGGCLGIQAFDTLSISGGTVSSSGADKGLYSGAQNMIIQIAGVGWTDTVGTAGKSLILASATAQNLTYKMLQFPAKIAEVTFKVVNGSWNDNTTANKTETLFGPEGVDLKLTANQIPAVGSRPSDTYKAGSWDTAPSTNTAITAATTYTYTYAQKDAAVVTKAPEAKTLTHNGQAQELVTAGSATGGTMQYALGTNARELEIN